MKPRLWKAGTVWHCWALGSEVSGCGLTPWKAYADWLRRRARSLEC